MYDMPSFFTGLHVFVALFYREIFAATFVQRGVGPLLTCYHICMFAC